MALVPVNDNAQGLLIQATADEQRFLLNFIVGNYLGPDVVGDAPKRSIMQRREEGLPAYQVNDLGGASLTLHQIECLYGYLLRNTHPSAILRDISLHQYFNGNLPLPKSGLLEDTNTRQFHYFFPLELHAQERRGRHSKLFKGIVMMFDPDVLRIQPDAQERFKLLTGRNELRIDRDAFERYCVGKRRERDERNTELRREKAAKRARMVAPLHSVPPAEGEGALAICLYTGSPGTGGDMGAGTSTGSESQIDSYMVELGLEPNYEIPIFYSGTAVGGQVGRIDIGVTDNSYYLRASFPGVDKDSGKVMCEAEGGGKFHIVGHTVTGERFVCKAGVIYCMKTQHMAPSGEFGISLKLPERVDPRTLRFTFKEGLLEAVVKKESPQVFQEEEDITQKQIILFQSNDPSA